MISLWQIAADTLLWSCCYSVVKLYLISSLRNELLLALLQVDSLPPRVVKRGIEEFENIPPGIALYLFYAKYHRFLHVNNLMRLSVTLHHY